MSGFSAFLPDLAAAGAGAISPVLASLSGAAAQGAGEAAGASAAAAPMGEGAAILIVLLVGFLPTEIWRSLAVLAGRNVEEGSAVLDWVKAVATALLAAVVARLVFAPTGALQAVPLMVRLAALGGGVAVFLVARRSVFAGVLAGEIILVTGAFLSAP